MKAESRQISQNFATGLKFVLSMMHIVVLNKCCSCWINSTSTFSRQHWQNSFNAN